MDIREKYDELKNACDAGKLMEFKNELTKNNSLDYLNFHYSLLWFGNRTFAAEILQAYKFILTKNNDCVIESTIIVCVQTVLKKKFGMSESRYGEISGNVEQSKFKAIHAIDKYLNDN